MIQEEQLLSLMHRNWEDLALDQKQRDEKAPYSAITVKKWVNGFELIMGQRDSDQRRC